MIGHFEIEFPYRLGLTKPCPTAVHIEPFSSSVLKVIIWIFDTAIKICTRGRFTQAYAKGFTTTLMPSYSSELCYLLWRLSIGTKLESHPCSGLVDLAGVLLHTPWWIPSSMTTVLLSRLTNNFGGVWWASI